MTTLECSASQSWVIYPGSVPHTWECLQRCFGRSLRSAKRLVIAVGEVSDVD